MIKLLPLLALCIACSPAGGNAANNDELAARIYATQTEAPTPNYRALLAEKPLQAGEWERVEASAPMPRDATAVGEIWLARLKQQNALLGYGIAGKSATGPVNMIDTGMTRGEFDSWVQENGWTVPRHIAWSFVPAMNLPRTSSEAARAIRFWPASTARTGAQNQALLGGRVYMRDGCFYVRARGEDGEKLAWFHAEMGLDIDDEGFFILRDRIGGRTLARLGEDMNWGGPASAEIDDQSKRALHEACGPGEIFVVGSPEASERFLTQFPHVRSPQAPPPPPAN